MPIKTSATFAYFFRYLLVLLYNFFDQDIFNKVGIYMKYTDLEDCLNPIKTEHPSYLEHLERYYFASKLCYNKKVLDIACGAGYGSRIIFDGGAKQVIGADISAKNIDYANTNYSKDNIVFCTHDVTHEFGDEFDVVISFETIEHVKDHISAMKTLYRATKNGGFLIISSPNRTITNPYLPQNTPCNDGGHVREYAIGEFRDLFVNTGFTEIGLFGQRMQRSFSSPLLEKHYKRLFKPSRKASPKVTQVHDLQPEYFVFVLAKNA
jgi:SAM-dependent methyltransferase